MSEETVRNGVKASAPVLATYIGLGMACGVVLYDAGFGLLGILAMSLLVYSGAAQFLSASMVVLGATNSAIILTVFFLNLRHILMAASMSKYVKDKNIGFITLFSHVLTDESYGVNYTKFREGNWSGNEALILSLTNYSGWVIGTVLGGAIGSQFTINTTIMNYALIAMFTCMMVNQFVSKEYIITAGISMVATVILTIVLQHNISLVLGAILASFIGYSLEKRKLAKGGIRSHDA